MRSLVIHLFKRPVFPFLVGTSITLISLFSCIIYLLESGVNPMVKTFGDALYLSIALLTTVGLGDVHPVTPFGKTVTALMMMLGAFLFVSFTGVISSSLHAIEKKLEK
ncbi:MAG: two pore domain potassium channel family protein [Xanthomonadaceae bacterium]|nr:two pore domain potassium channel family protein [Xanthomonadaceae bacterium]